MKRLLVFLVILVVLSSLLFLFEHYYLPMECIFTKRDVCIEKTADSESRGLIKRVCNIVSKEDCLKILARIHSKNKDNLIPYVSDDLCLSGLSAFCAFSSIAYSGDGDRASSRRYATKGCDLNEGVSCAVLAELELEEEREEEALKLSIKGCMMGSAAACAIAGTIMIERGENNEGMQFINRCCQLGAEECCE